jgi:glycosyltransferase involved in cell wall biosynthesis
MRVLYLTMNSNRASTTVPTEGWFHVLRPRGLEPVVVSHKPGAFHAWVAEQGIPAYHIPLPPPRKLWPWAFLRSLWSLRRLVRQHRIDLIHCNEQDIYPIGQYLARLCRLPVVVSIHFTMDPAFCNWAFAGRRQPARMFFLGRGSREACRYGVAPVLPEDRWRLLPNGLDLERFRPDLSLREEFRHRHGLDGDVVLGVACALRPRKQLEHLFEAATRLQNPRVKVVVAGGPVAGDEAYAEGLLAEARSRLGDRLVPLGHLDELRGLYNGLDVFVNTSQEEACSISVLESLACGCPVVGYPSKSVDEQVLPGGGQMVEQGRVDLLAAALAGWASDAPRREAGRRGARARAEVAYDIRRLSADLWDEYEAVLEEAGGKRPRATAARPPADHILA